MFTAPLNGTAAITSGFTGRELTIASHLAGMPMTTKQRINGLVVERVAEGSWHVAAERHLPVNRAVAVLVAL